MCKVRKENCLCRWICVCQWMCVCHWICVCQWMCVCQCTIFWSWKSLKTSVHFPYRTISEWGKKCRKYGKRSLRSVIKIQFSHDQLIRNSQTETPNSISSRSAITNVTQIGQVMLQPAYKCSWVHKGDFHETHADGTGFEKVLLYTISWNVKEGSAVDRLIAVVSTQADSGSQHTGW